MSEGENSQTEQPESLSVYSVIAVMIEQMDSLARQKLGLLPDPISQKIEMNLNEAKVAIDLVAHLGELVESELDDEDRRRIKNVVTDLRVNYVQKNKEAQT